MANLITTLEARNGDKLLPRTKIKALFDEDGNYINSEVTAEDINKMHYSAAGLFTIVNDEICITF